MDLKIKDVAELLDVSESTVQRWAIEGDIPTYRLQKNSDYYYFSRTEMEDWMISKKLDTIHSAPILCGKEEASLSARAITGSNQFSLFRAIHKGEVLLHIPHGTKEEVIRSIMHKTAHNLHVDADIMTDLLLDRELLMSTALNNGIAVPHTRDFLLNHYQDVLIVVFLEQPIEYGALDGKPVHTLFFLFASEDKRHLHLLAKLAYLSNDPQALAFFRKQPIKEELLSFIRSWESKFSQNGSHNKYDR